jgi:hypothetical protein
MSIKYKHFLVSFQKEEEILFLVFFDTKENKYFKGPIETTNSDIFEIENEIKNYSINILNICETKIKIDFKGFSIILTSDENNEKIINLENKIKYFEKKMENILKDFDFLKEENNFLKNEIFVLKKEITSTNGILLDNNSLLSNLTLANHENQSETNKKLTSLYNKYTKLAGIDKLGGQVLIGYKDIAGLSVPVFVKKYCSFEEFMLPLKTDNKFFNSLLILNSLENIQIDKFDLCALTGITIVDKNLSIIYKDKTISDQKWSNKGIKNVYDFCEKNKINFVLNGMKNFDVNNFN